MHLLLVSPEKTILDESILSATIPTRDGTITVLANHEALLSALAPGILTVTLSDKQVLSYALGGGALETDGKHLNIVADMVDEGSLTSEEIQQQKAQTLALMNEYRKDHSAMDPQQLIELEENLMKIQAMEGLAQNHGVNASR